MPTWSATWTWFSSLKSFSAEICDASGRVIRKLGKGDLNYTEYSQHLADDAAYYWLEPAVIGLPMYRPLPLRDGAQERHVRHAAFRPAVDRHRRSTGKGAFPAVEPCRLCVQLPMHALPCRTRAAYGSRPRQLRMDIPVPHGRARRTADSARPRTAADPLLRAVGVHLRQNAREYAGLAPFRRLDGRTARGPRTAASGLAGRNTRPNRHDPRQTGKIEALYRYLGRTTAT